MKNHTQNLGSFQTNSFLLRPVQLGDEDIIFRFNKKMEHLQYVARSPYTEIQQAKDHLHRYLRGMAMGTMAWWAIIDLNSKQGIGYIGLFGIDPDGHGAELGYGIVKEFWGKGVISEAVRLLANYAKETLKIHRLCAMVDEDNLASQRVLEKNGFEEEGLLRDVDFARQRYFSMKVYALF